MASLYEVSPSRKITTTLTVSPDGVVVAAEPFLKNAIGLHFSFVRKWVAGRGGNIRLLSENPLERLSGPRDRERKTHREERPVSPNTGA